MTRLSSSPGISRPLASGVDVKPAICMQRTERWTSYRALHISSESENKKKVHEDEEEYSVTLRRGKSIQLKVVQCVSRGLACTRQCPSEPTPRPLPARPLPVPRRSMTSITSSANSSFKVSSPYLIVLHSPTTRITSYCAACSRMTLDLKVCIDRDLQYEAYDVFYNVGTADIEPEKPNCDRSGSTGRTHGAFQRVCTLGAAHWHASHTNVTRRASADACSFDN